MTPRRAAVLAMQLPAGAQTWISCGHDNAWTLGEHLAASLFDALNIANWQRAADPSAPRPTPVIRPSNAAERATEGDQRAERARRFLERQQAQTEQPNPKEA